MENNSSAVLATLSLLPTGSWIVRIENLFFWLPTCLQFVFRTSQGHHTRRRTLWRTRWISVYRFHCQNCKLGSLEEHHLSGNLTFLKHPCPFTYSICLDLRHPVSWRRHFRRSVQILGRELWRKRSTQGKSDCRGSTWASYQPGSRVGEAQGNWELGRRRFNASQTWLVRLLIFCGILIVFVYIYVSFW